MGLNLDKYKKGNYHLNVSRVGSNLHLRWLNSTHLTTHEGGAANLPTLPFCTGKGRRAAQVTDAQTTTQQ